MSNERMTVPQLQLTQEQLDAISGGSCTPLEMVQVATALKETYESLVDLTSYMIERVANSTTP
jgi:hypothetical protein